ncbi:MAG: hypothetical protein RR338_06195, partial [Clostridia bacterium]
LVGAVQTQFPQNIEILRSYSTGVISVKAVSLNCDILLEVGGLVGTTDSNVSGSYFSGNITAEANCTDGATKASKGNVVTVALHIAGISVNSPLENCFAKGTLTATINAPTSVEKTIEMGAISAEKGNLSNCYAGEMTFLRLINTTQPGNINQILSKISKPTATVVDVELLPDISLLSLSNQRKMGFFAYTNLVDVLLGKSRVWNVVDEKLPTMFWEK